MGASACPARMGDCGAYSLELHFAKVLDAAHGLCRFRVSWRHSRTPSFALCRAERATAARYPTSCSHLCRSPAALAMSKAGVVAALMGLYGASSTRWSGCTTTSMMANENAERSATRRRREATALTLTLLSIFSIGFWDLATYGEEPYMGS